VGYKTKWRYDGQDSYLADHAVSTLRLLFLRFALWSYLLARPLLITRQRCQVLPHMGGGSPATATNNYILITTV